MRAITRLFLVCNTKPLILMIWVLKRLLHSAMKTVAEQNALVVADALADFLSTDAVSKTPFYAQVGFFETHRPHDFGDVEPDDSKGVDVPPYLVDDEISRRELALQQGAIRRVDAAVQIITDALRESGLEDDTLLVFTVDHGIEFPRAKWFCYDAGIGVALLMRWPGGGIEGGQACDHLLSNVDFFAHAYGSHTAFHSR